MATEGIVQFHCTLAAGPAPGTDGTALRELAGWRRILHRLHLLGQTPTAYDGLAFGNVSLRLGDGFLVTASQTSGIECLTADDWVFVHDVDIASFATRATGTQPPSSEAMTHAVIYATNPQIRYVLHVHSPSIWQQATALGLPATSPRAANGTPGLMQETSELVARAPKLPLVFVSPGHEDGVFACGDQLDTTGGALLATLASALAVAP
ncbi:MAG: class II aldolase/adducin family protein [Pseudomonadales bacterium]